MDGLAVAGLTPRGVPSRGRRGFLALLSAVAVLVAACTGDDGGEPGGLSAEPFSLDLEAGQCFDRPDDPDVESVEAVPCRRPHDLEVFATFDLEGGEQFPGPGVVANRAGEGCQERFADYVGVSQDSSGLLIVPYAPDAFAWETGDRTVTCAVALSEGRLEESVEGSERQG